MTSLNVAAASIRRDETVATVPLVAVAGGFIDAYAWIQHGNAAMPAEVFIRVKGVACSTVMITGNMRMAIEHMFAALAGGGRAGTLRGSGIFAALCAVLGFGAAVGAITTRAFPQPALVIPVLALLAVLLRCEVYRSEAAR